MNLSFYFFPKYFVKSWVLDIDLHKYLVVLIMWLHFLNGNRTGVFHLHPVNMT